MYKHLPLVVRSFFNHPNNRSVHFVLFPFIYSFILFTFYFQLYRIEYRWYHPQRADIFHSVERHCSFKSNVQLSWFSCVNFIRAGCDCGSSSREINHGEYGSKLFEEEICTVNLSASQKCDPGPPQTREWANSTVLRASLAVRTYVAKISRTQTLFFDLFRKKNFPVTLLRGAKILHLVFDLCQVKAHIPYALSVPAPFDAQQYFQAVPLMSREATNNSRNIAWNVVESTLVGMGVQLMQRASVRLTKSCSPARLQLVKQPYL